MPFASTMGSGMCMAMPDVCKTPTPPVGPVPIPIRTSPNSRWPILALAP